MLRPARPLAPMPDDAAAPRPAAPGWQASLALHIARRGARTVLASSRHRGPLRVQRPLYPEGPQTVQVLLIHPPGGIAGGDALDIAVQADADSHAMLTTPGAGKWYKANGRWATQDVQLRIAPGATLEWLPQESIHFNGCWAAQQLRVDCATNGRACGWDIGVLGRQASGERFDDGRLHQSLEIRRDGQLLWADYARLRGDDPLLRSPLGWHGRHVSGLLWLLADDADDALLATCRALTLPAGVRAGVTRPAPGLLLARALGDSPERVRGWLSAVWSVLRPARLGRPGTAPRIWAT